MLNLFSFKATFPKDMVVAEDPVGPGNDEAFGYYRTRVGLIVAAWGSVNPLWRTKLLWYRRIDQVLQAVGKRVECLGKTKDGSPRHPSRIAYDTPRELYWEPSTNAERRSK